MNSRAIAAKLSWQIIDKGQSLDAALVQHFETADLAPQDRGFVQELVYGVCRWYGELNAEAATLLRSPIRNKDRVVHYILLVGLYQLSKLETADHAAISETVSAAQQLNKKWATKLINGCLRSFQRRPERSQPRDDALSHPKWMVQAIQKAWPQHFQAILQANNQRPPMCLRVNRQQYSRDEYLAQLEQHKIAAERDPHSKDGVILTHAMTVAALPGFTTGSCSVQDTAAQLTADLMAVETGMTVLDACAAPGGKTAHLLERTNSQLKMDALDISERRCEQLNSTLARLNLNANVVAADASVAPKWQAPDTGYDRILIDAPCSGLGVIRRHPDIKHHRRESDISSLNAVQAQLLDNLWKLLKPKGRMLYMTCSILPQENEKQIHRFVEQQNDVMLIDMVHPNAIALEHGIQSLPGVHNMDGFYYCILEKSS